MLSLGVACVVATHDDRLRPEIARAWGIALDRDAVRLEVCIRGDSDCRTLVNLRENGQLAVNVTRPTTYRSVQLKGRARVLGAPTDEQLRRAEEHLARFAAEAAEVGLPPALAPRLMGRLCAAITLEIEQIFDQSPGIGAGRQL
jgi:Pyridoxamine 5'-phosphate oxidase